MVTFNKIILLITLVVSIFICNFMLSNNDNYMSQIIECGDCRHPEQTHNNYLWMEYDLTDSGVLTIYGNDLLCGNLDYIEEPVKEYNDVFLTPHFTSIFKNLDFNTVVVSPSVQGLGSGCLSDCKNLKHLYLPPTHISIYKDFTDPEILDNLIIHNSNFINYIDPDNEPLTEPPPNSGDTLPF